MSSDVQATPETAATSATPPLTSFQTINAYIRRTTDRFLNLWSLITIVLVTAILVTCIALWDVVWLRPVLATAGAGLAAFLGPIPGIISPETRSKWLVTIFVSALIAAATWFATKDLEVQLRESEEARVALDTRVVAQKETLAALIQGSGKEAQDQIFIEGARLLKSLQQGDQYQQVLDLALPLLKLRPDNGTALAFAGYAYRSLGLNEEAKKKFENYVAASEGVLDAKDGPQKACYERVDGFCAERTGWIEHRLAAIAIEQARAAEGKEKLKLLREAYDHEKRNIEILKWSRSGKDQGFDANDEEPLSSCAVLLELSTMLAQMKRLTNDVDTLRKTTLKCE